MAKCFIPIVSSLLGVVMLCSCGSTTPDAGMSTIGPLRKAGGLLPPSTEFGRPAIVTKLDGKRHQGPAFIDIAPGPHVATLQALNYDTNQIASADVPFVAVAGVGYFTKARSAGNHVKFQIVDVRDPNTVVAERLDSGTPVPTRLTEMDLLMRPLMKSLTDDRP